MYKAILVLLLSLLSQSLLGQQFVGSAKDTPAKLWGFINLDDASKNIPAMYQTVGGFSEEFSAVSNGDHWGYINEQNQLVIDYQFDYAKSFHQHRAIIKKDEFYGIINKKGEFVIEPKYYDLLFFQQGNEQYYISRDSSFFQGILDVNGQQVIAHKYTYIIPYHGNFNNEFLYKNILFYAAFQEINPEYGDFYTQFSQNPYLFSPEKGRLDLYDFQFNKIASRQASLYEDGFQHQELLAIDRFLEENKDLSIAAKRKGVDELLASSIPVEDEYLAMDSLKEKYHSKTPDEIKRYLEGIGYTILTDDKGMVGLKKGGDILIPADDHSLNLMQIPVHHPLQEDIPYFKQHFAGEYRIPDQDLLDTYCIVVNQGDKANIYSLSGKNLLTLIKGEKTLAGINKIGIKYRQVSQGLETYGLVNWAGENVLLPQYEQIIVTVHDDILVKQKMSNKDSLEIQAGLFNKIGEVIIPAGLYAEIHPINSLTNTYLATCKEPLSGQQKNSIQGNKNFEVLRVKENGYEVINKVTALSLITWSVGQESHLLPYEQEQASSASK